MKPIHFNESISDVLCGLLKCAFSFTNNQKYHTQEKQSGASHSFPGVGNNGIYCLYRVQKQQ